MLKRIQAVLEPMVRDNPGNNVYRDTLLRTYRAAALAFLGLGDLARSLDFEQKALKLEPPSALPRDAVERAIRLARTGSLQLRLGNRGAAEVMWRKALVGFDQAARDSERRWSADRRNLSALETRRLAEAGAAFTMETLGGRERVHRGNPARQDILTDSADGWRNRADAMDTFGSPIPARLEAAGKALELSRRLAAADPSAANRFGLAHSLRLRGDAFRAAARCSKGAESISAYQHSRDSYVEAINILTSLKQSGQLPGAGHADLVTLTNNLADAGERLRERHDQRALPGQ